MTRFPDWPMLLDSIVTARLRAPFAWGVNDCALFAADCVLAMTGVDLAKDLRGLNALQASRYVRSCGGMSGVASKALGPACRVRDAVQGDVLLVPAGKRKALAVHSGNGALLPGANGLMMVPLSVAVLAWRI